MASATILSEHAFPDRLRLRPVHLGGPLFVMYAGAQLGGLDSGRDALWRWLACERLRPPMRDEVNGWRRRVGESRFERLCWRALTATFGLPWHEVSPETAGWQMGRIDGLPGWYQDRLFSGQWSEDRQDRLRRALVGEDVSKMRQAMAAIRMYEERVFDRPAVVGG